MIAYFLLGVCLLVAALLGLRAFVSADPRKLAQVLRYTAGTVLGGGAVYLLFIGRVGPAMLLGAGALMALGRWPAGGLAGLLGGFLGGFGSMGGPQGWTRAGSGSSGQTSEVETPYLRMGLNHDTGEMGGVVLAGRFRGRQLAELSFAELQELLAECRVADNQAAALLETYLDRAVGEDWRERARDHGAGESTAPGGKMTPEEAREILGLGPDATPDEVREAYHRLMLKLHPDQGGSNYLAAKINAAKDVLLGS